MLFFNHHQLGRRPAVSFRVIAGLTVTVLAAGLALTGCRSPHRAREGADRHAQAALAHAQRQALGRVETIEVLTAAETFRRRLIDTQDLPVAMALSADPSQLPALPHWDPAWRVLSTAAVPVITRTTAVGTPVLTLTDALRLAAHGNRDYQARKESLFLTALALDVEAEAFRHTLAGMWGGQAELTQSDDTVAAGGLESSLSATRMLRTGTRVAAALTLDLVNLLTQDRASAFGVGLDTSVTIPLGRGAGRHIVMESLTQAQRDLVMAVWDFEQAKADFAIDVATRYFNLLAAEDQMRNASENHRRLKANADRARRMADAGRLPEIQVDQAAQEALRASVRALAAVRRHADALDQFKLFLGLPPDADVRLTRDELDALVDRVTSVIPLESTASDNRAADLNDAESPADAVLEEAEAVKRALENRLDLRAEIWRVEDAQRKVIVAADALGPEITLSADANFGERRSLSAADQDDAELRFDRGRYGSLLRIDAPWQRTAERTALRRRLIELEQAIRRVQATEDRVKSQVRGDLRGLALARDNVAIQADAMRIAQRRVRSTDLFLEAGRAVIRDVLEAQDALLSAQNAFTDAVVEYRLTELGFQRNLGVLQVDANGLWTEWQQVDEDAL